jgi:hypothetical protein
MELAEIIAPESVSKVISEEAFGENDRSSTGYLPGEQFEAVVAMEASDG